MSERIHALAQQLLGKPSVDECTVEEIQHLANRYPYFAPAQFLLLQKLKATNSTDLAAQQQKAVLYYHDPLQFDYFISSDKFLVEEDILPQADQESPEDSDEIYAIIAGENSPVNADAFLQIKTVSEPNDDNEKSFVSAEAVPVSGDDHSTDNAVHFMQPEKVEEPESIDVPEPVVLAVTPLHESPETIGTEIIETTESSVVEEKESLVQSSFVGATQVDDERTEPSTEKEKSSLKETHQNAASTMVEPLAFEPFYTVDYFASQGIKITQDELSKDKLSKQLRSFTDWLKMMKRLPAAEMAQVPQSTAEKSVENLASHSVEESDVVTEAMAEVWAKQGARQKAIETYNKLSLLNPSKRAYFAAKIENLKGS